jgi:GT2 family glycosyltransferase
VHVSFVVPTYKRPEALRATLTRLLDLDYKPDRYEIVVVDDGSGDSTPDVVLDVASASVPVEYVAKVNAGVASARNAGAARARGALLIFLDDDMLVERDHIWRHLAVQEEYGDCLANGHWEFAPEVLSELLRTPFGRLRLGIEDWVKTGMTKEPLDDGRFRPAGVTACNLGISRRRFNALAGFDESFPLAGCEDQEFSHRARLSGCTFIYDPGIRLLHNDERVTLDQFCARQRQGALTSVYLVARHPDEFAGRPLLLENAPITAFDPSRLKVKKVLKRIYSSGVGLAVARVSTNALERLAPESRALQRIYSMTIGAHIFAGIRDGLASLPEARVAARRAMRSRHAGA